MPLILIYVCSLRHYLYYLHPYDTHSIYQKKHIYIPYSLIKVSKFDLHYRPYLSIQDNLYKFLF